MNKILGVNKRYYPYPSPMHGRDIALTIVLVEGDIGDYAAYAGLHEDLEFIRDYGDKISFEEACCHFPGGQLKRELYRD